MSILDVKDLTHSFGDKKLFNNVSMQLFRGDKMGLTGLNGAGKSTFINILTENVIPDDGLIKWNPKIKIGYLDQQAKIDMTLSVRKYLKEAYQHLYDADARLNELNTQIAVCKDQKALAELLEQSGLCQSIIDSGNFYAIDSEIEKIAAGLGITAFGLDTPVSRLSGGQRAKVMLAKLLLESPDVLLLDEPTNFLDKEHIDWLAKYLQAFKGTFLLVSHDQIFLNRVTNCICDIEFFSISRYNGNFESFKNQKEQKGEEYLRSYNRQQKEVAKLEDYISRNLYRASTTKMAQSRRKKLEKLDLIDKPQQAPKPTFAFQYQPLSPKIMLRVKSLAVGYTEPLLPDLNLLLKTGEKLAITGFNGIGKTTFLKTIANLLPPISGSFKLDESVKIGYFEQENRWDNPSKTAFAEIKDAYPRFKDKEVRSWLAQCGLRQEQVMQSLSTLSGGEQAKVKLCKLILTPCNLLILDEPTNHLDVNAIEQLKTALINFEGSVIFVSHSREFCDAITERILNLEKLFD